MALCLFALLGVLATGLPSHHHLEPEPADSDVRLVSGDHHSHATQLVQQDDRATSGSPEIPAVVTSYFAPPTPAAVPALPGQDRPLRPTERAPPPGAPRAPPLSA